MMSGVDPGKGKLANYGSKGCPDWEQGRRTGVEGLWSRMTFRFAEPKHYPENSLNGNQLHKPCLNSRKRLLNCMWPRPSFRAPLRCSDL